MIWCNQKLENSCKFGCIKWLIEDELRLLKWEEKLIITVKCTLKTAYRTNIYASINFSDLIIKRYTARYETTSRHWILVDISWKTSVDLEFNKTMYLLKRFDTDTLVSIKLKRTNMSYLKYRWDGSLAEMLRISRSW